MINMNWYERFKDLFKRKIEPTSIDSIFSRMDVDQFFATLNNMWHPKEVLKKIGGPSNIDILTIDPDIYSAIDKRIANIHTTQIGFEGENNQLIEFFKDQILPHERQLKEDLWWAVFQGYAVEQIIYNEDRSGRVVGFQKEEFWRFEPQPDLIHIRCVHTTNSELSQKILPYGKWVLLTNGGTSYNPIGKMMAERLINPWFFKCTGWDLWIDFAKKFANGFIHAKIEDTDQSDKVKKRLMEYGKSGIIVTDKSTDIILNQPSRDSSLYDLLNSRSISAINRVILGETLTSDVDGGGSYSAAKIHNGVREDKTWSDISLIEKGLNEIIRQIGDVNGFPEEALPKAVISWDPGFNIEQAERDSRLSALGVKFKKEYFEKTYGLNPDDFDIKEETVSPWGFSKKKDSFLSLQDMKDYIGAPPPCAHKLDAQSSRYARRYEDETDEIVSFLKRNAAPPIDPEDLASAILTSNTEKELDEKLEALFNTRNNAFVDQMTEALYYAAARGAMLGNPEVIKDEKE